MTTLRTVTLEVVKKNRVYFKCLNEKGFEVKLKITPESENLNLGKQTLLVRDETVRTKYGIDVIYSLEAEVKDKGIVTLVSRYNKRLVESCRELGGKWDSDNKAWVFPKIVEDKIEELDHYYNTNIKAVEICATEDIFCHNEAVHFFGYPIARATGRDSGANVCEDVSLISGNITSEGSMKNWGTEVKKGATFRLEISQQIIDKYLSLTEHKWDLKIL